MSIEIQVFDVVALTEDIPERGLVCGQVGTVVEAHGGGTFGFTDNEGKNYAMLPLKSSQLLVLHYQPASCAHSPRWPGL